MARGVKKIPATLEAQLEETDRRIQEHTDILKKLKDTRKMIVDQIEQKKKDELYTLFVDSGKSIDDLKALLESK